MYGPFNYTGSAIDTAFIAPDFRTNVTVGPWYSHEDYADRHGSFFSNADGGQWFYASNDRSHSTDIAHRDVYRDTVVGYVHFFVNGSMQAVTIDGTGVGAYDVSPSASAAAARVEAENFMRRDGRADKRHLPALGDAIVVAVDGPAALHYPRVTGAACGTSLALTVAHAGAAHALLRARRGAADGAVLATCEVSPTGGAFARVACPLALEPADAVRLDLVLELGADANGLLLDSFAIIA